MPAQLRARTSVGCGGDLGDELEHAVEDLVEVDLLGQALRQGVVDDRDRVDPSHRLRQGVARLVGVRAPRLDAQQRRHRLQVVLDPMVDLADRRVLGDELLLLVAQLADIAAEDDCPDTGAVVFERYGAQ